MTPLDAIMADDMPVPGRVAAEVTEETKGFDLAWNPCGLQTHGRTAAGMSLLLEQEPPPPLHILKAVRWNPPADDL